jgi:hypothetical protein
VCVAATQPQPASLADRSAWPSARLIPTAGLKNREEQESRGSSCLLAVLRAVPEFGHALLKDLDAPRSTVIETYTEVRFKDATGKSARPDGAIVCERAGKVWTCLVEVKTGGAPLKSDQVSAYLDIARDNGFDGVLTISNQITSSAIPCARGMSGPWSVVLWLLQDLGHHPLALYLLQYSRMSDGDRHGMGDGGRYLFAVGQSYVHPGELAVH